jgi:hypothetical protein
MLQKCRENTNLERSLSHGWANKIGLLPTNKYTLSQSIIEIENRFIQELTGVLEVPNMTLAN